MDEFSLWSRIAQQFRTSCASFDGTWIKRRRVFDTESVVTGLMHMTGGSQASYAQTMDFLPFKHAPAPAASSFCEARAKLAPHVIQEIRRDILDLWDEERVGTRWRGRRLFAVDGSKVTLPQNLFGEGFKAPASGHCPQGMVSLLLRLDDKMTCDIRLSSHENERHEAHEHLNFLAADDLVIYDRGYLCFSLLTAHKAHGIGAVFRVQKGQTFLPIKRFWAGTSLDETVTIDPTSVTYRHSSKQHPEYELGPQQLRLIKYSIKNQTYVLATTIVDASIPAEDFVALYAQRWQAEETFKAFKQTLNLEVFRGKSRHGVSQEIEAMGLLWNLTQVIGAIAHPKKTLIAA